MADGGAKPLPNGFRAYFIGTANSGRFPMKIRTTVVALALVVAPTLALAMGDCGSKATSTSAASCAEGTMWDARAQACVPTVTG